jgi:amino acid adenylation domain-containing protein/thioester reductase-like protein
MVSRPRPILSPSTLVELLRRRAHDQPDKLAYTYLVDGESQEVNLVYRELDRRARAIGARLQKLGMKGERALLLYPPGLDYIASFFGCLYAGVVAVPAYPPRLNRPVPRIQAIVADSRATVALTTNAILENIESRFEHTPDLAALTWLNTERPPAGLEGEWQDPDITADTLAFLQYTSGSTAAPKGVMLSHGNLIHNLEIINYGFQIAEGGVGVFWLPSYHDMGLIGGILEPMYVGERSILMSPVSFLQRPLRWLQTITRYRGTITGAPNFAYDMCVNKIKPEGREGLELSSLQTVFCGAEPIRAETLEQFADAFEPYGFRREAFYPCYGLAEGTLLVSGGEGAGRPVVQAVRRDALMDNHVVPAAEEDERSQQLVGSGGTLPGQTILIVDPETRLPCAPDEIGEIWVAGPSVAQGYWDQPEETRSAFHAYLADTGEGPFLRTGDLGFMQGGELFITGRLKDLIIIRGRNYYPQDIEKTVESCHQALQSIAGASFSVDSDGGERLVVVHELAREHRNANPEEVIAAVRRAIAESHELQVYAVALLNPHSIPMTSSGKVKRHACKSDFLAGKLKTRAEWRAPALREARAETQEGELPAPQMASDRADPSAMTTERAIEAWLIHQIAARIGLPPSEVDPHEPFTYYGLDSVEAVGLTGDLEIWLGRSLSPTLAWDYPNISRLAHHLAGGTSQKPEQAHAPAAKTHREPIAIIGLGCRFPGALSPEAFWRLLRDGVDAIQEVPSDRWAVDDFYDPEADSPGKVNTRWGGFLGDVASFDPHFFGISPREAVRMDPQQRLLLEVAWEALENAGQAADGLAGSQTGVFVGISSYDYSRLQFGDLAGIDAYAGTGNAHSIAANRLSYALDLRGPSMAVDTACSSSLVAVHLAMQSLLDRESSLALAGGVNLILSPELTITFSQARMMASDGRCKTFDARADGYVRGEGCGVVVLKRLSDALRDGDRILALLRGSAINQDGRSNGLTAPNGPSQQAVIRRALENASVKPSQVGYVEAHGTGTPLGDPIELQSLQAVLDGGRSADQRYAVGSVKTNIGHLEAAAGVAGLIKVILSLTHEEIPPHLHLAEINPHIQLEGSPLEIVTKGRPWMRGQAPRIAGVSSFGFGGTNAHLVVAEAPRLEEVEPPGDRIERPRHLLTLSARNRDSLQSLVSRYERHLDGQPEASLADICYTANTGRAHFERRLAIIAGSTGDCQAALNAYLSGESAPDVIQGSKPAGSMPRPVFLFTGQGSQYVGMGRQLYETQPVFKRVLDQCADLLKPDLGRPLLSVIYPDLDEESPLDETQYTQPAIFALEYALAELWRSWGVEPAAVMGHSVGEYVAACVAGVFSLEDGLRLIAARGRLMQSLSVKGSMAAVFAARATVEAHLDPYRDQVVIAAINGPEHIVISGEEGAVAAVLAEFEREGVLGRPLNVSHGFHSPLMHPILADFERNAASLQFLPPQIPLVSNLRGEIWDADSVPAAGYWRRHIGEPVDFAAGIHTLADEGFEIFLEIGPTPVLSGMGRRCLAGRDTPGSGRGMAWLPTLRKGKEDWQVILQSLGNLYVRGLEVDWAGFDRDYPWQKVALPTYPFARERHWLEPTASTATLVAAPQAARHPVLGQRLRSPYPIFETQLDLGRLPDLDPILRKMARSAASQLFGQGPHQLDELRVRERPQQEEKSAVVQTIITPEGARRALVEIYATMQGQGEWTLLARGVISPGDSDARMEIPAEEQEASEDGANQLTRELVLDAEPKARQALVAEHLRGQVARILGIDPARLDATQPLDQLGFDSLMAIELKNSLERGLGVGLPIVSFLEGPSIAELGEQVFAGLAAPAEDPGVSLTAAQEYGGDHPVGYNQQSLWLLRQLVPEDISFNVSGAVRIHGDLSVDALRRALENLMARHAVLRTTFTVVDGQPVQQVHERLPAPFRVIDASGWSETDIHDYLRKKAYQPFAVERAPAFRVILLHRGGSEPDPGSEGSPAETATLLLAMDHMISDFWSVSVLVREALMYYQGEVSGHPLSLEPLPIQYTDYVRWQRERLAGPDGHRLLAYWKKQLGADLPVLDLPTDHPRPPLQTFRGDSRSISLSARLTAGLKALAGRQNATLFMTLLAAFQVLLHRYSGQDEFIVGSVTAGRSQPDLMDLVGYFINPLALRADLSENPTFTQMMSRVRRTVLNALEHQDCPPALLADNLDLPRDPSRPPLFETMFILQKAQIPDVSALSSFALGIGGEELEIAGLTLESLPLDRQPAQFDLTLMMAEAEDRLVATMFYNSDLFEGSTIQRMLGHLETLLDGLQADPERPVASTPMLTPAERQHLLSAWNATAMAYPPVEGVHQLFEAQVDRTPDAIAVRFEGQSLTYRALNERANLVAHHLQSLGVSPEKLVGIYLDRSPAMVVALLGVLKAGGAYVPLDPDFPQERVAMMLADSQPLVLLTEERLRDTLPALDSRVVSMDGDWEEIAQGRTTNLVSGVSGDDLAYLIYTSGSTGIPKGVQIPHRAMVNFLIAMEAEPGLTEDDLLLAVTTLSFDIAVLELFLPLVVGACVEVVSREIASDGARLREKLAASGATVMQATPATWRLLLEAGWQGDHRPITRGGSKDSAPVGMGLKILCGGEALPRDLAEKLLARGAEVWNMYGPTETTVWSTIYRVPSGSGPIPVGRPIANTQVYVLDHARQPVPVGVVGELYIGGDGVARGYRNRPELTAERFIQDPFRSDPHARLYRTGDLARLRADGNLIFLGRMDHQVKVRGFRIELGEIEAALRKHEVLRHSVVVAHEDASGDVRLVAYLVLNDRSEAPSVTALRAFLKRWLPDYMLPAAFVTLDALPLTPNGKVDRRALPKPAAVRPNLGESYVAPRNEQEEEIAALCAQALGLERVGIHDDFFELGGNSLLATRLIFQLQEHFECRLPLIRLFETPTVAGLSAALDAIRLDTGDGPGLFGTITLEELQEEANLAKTIGANGLVYEHKEHPEKILLTGATGFVGAFLLSELLAETRSDVYCLVRAETPEMGMARIRKNLKKYWLWDERLETRVHPLIGDFSQHALALPERDYAQLADELDVIYHNGALVNFVFPYHAHKQVNVDGTLEIIRLASEKRIKPVHFVSTLAVFLSDKDRDGKIWYEDVDLEEIGVPYGGYAQSKWVAEKMLSMAGDLGIPTSIYRPGPIAGHSRSGVWNEDDLICNMVKACITMGAVPDLSIMLDIVPVDYVSKAIVHISQNRKSLGKAFNLSTSQQINFTELINLVGDFGYPLSHIPFEDWKADLFELAIHDPDGGWQVFLPLINEIDMDVVSMPHFDQANTRDGLKGSGIENMALGPEMMKTYFNYFVESGMLNPPIK